LGLTDQQSLVNVKVFYNIFFIKVTFVHYLIFVIFEHLLCCMPTMVYPFAATFCMSKDLMCSSTTVNIGPDNINAYEPSSSCDLCSVVIFTSL